MFLIIFKPDSESKRLSSPFFNQFQSLHLWSSGVRAGFSTRDNLSLAALITLSFLTMETWAWAIQWHSWKESLGPLTPSWAHLLFPMSQQTMLPRLKACLGYFSSSQSWEPPTRTLVWSPWFPTAHYPQGGLPCPAAWNPTGLPSHLSWLCSQCVSLWPLCLQVQRTDFM